MALGSAHALGVGRPSNVAVLGQPLDLAVPLSLDSGDDVSPNCFGADVYFGDNKVPAPVVSVQIEGGGGDARILHILTTRRIDEPVVTVYLSAGCLSKITRKFVAFADPPEFHAAQVAPAPDVAASTEAAPQSGVAATDNTSRPVSAAPFTAPVSPATSGAPAAPSAVTLPPTPLASTASSPSGTEHHARHGRARHPEVAAAAPTSMPARIAAALHAKPTREPPPIATSTTTPTSGASLHLDPIETDAVISPALRMSLSLGAPTEGGDAKVLQERRAAAAALWRSLNASPEDMVRDRQRLQELEDRLAQLRKDTAGAEQTVTTLQAQVKQAEGQRWANPVVYALLALCAALTACLVWLWRARAQQQQMWWAGVGASADGAPSLSSENPTQPSVAEPKFDVPAKPGADGEALKVPAPVPPAPKKAPPPAAKPEVKDVPVRATPTTKTASPVALGGPIIQAPPREVSVEELIDLEQQAEFFVVLGQDQAAIDLLEGHVRGTTGASPLPYLKLLEIYQRRGERENYDGVREIFNERFNAYAPAWEADIAHGGHTLDGYSGVIERLQSLWQTPPKAMEVLQASLLRQDKDAETFDLPAYRELLFLYGIARDLSEHAGEGVDLLLPIDTSKSASEAPAQVEPLLATRSIAANPALRPALTVDLDLDDVATAPPDADLPTDHGGDDKI